ncbi:DUF309 domain-containing protein [Schlesneria paludicola]|uniref:DUF309 domain-containing protein n=1 Tax=Schlesneria paludicola TaxID=360056 RepID=UPI0006802919|nr:DUF309 domain-containing protein [Schlesneria paludicola]
MMLERYLPEIAMPAYAFVPARHPHPVTDARGHSFGRTAVPVSPLDTHQPFRSTEYLHAIDLFNAGYYWEAHEEWEGLWVAAGRAGVAGNFLKGLIKLAAAGVKSREGQGGGVKRHAKRAGELFRITRANLPEGQAVYAGLTLDNLVQVATELESHPIIDDSFSVGGQPVLCIRLTLTAS